MSTRFLRITDLDLVTGVVNLDSIEVITLVHNGRPENGLLPGQPAYQPIVSILLKNGNLIERVMVPTVRQGNLDTAEQAIWSYFDKLEIGRPE